MSKYDWDAIKTEYVTKGATIRDLACRYGAAKTAIQNRNAKEGWTEEREKFLAKAAKQRDALAEKRAITTALKNAKTEGKGLDAIADTMVKEVKRVSTMLEDTDMSAQTRYNLMRCLEIANKLYKDSMGIISKAEADRLEMARAELKMKQEEHAKFMSESNQGTEPIQVEFKDDIKEFSE